MVVVGLVPPGAEEEPPLGRVTLDGMGVHVEDEYGMVAEPESETEIDVGTGAGSVQGALELGFGAGSDHGALELGAGGA